MSKIHEGYYERTYFTGIPRTLFYVSVGGDEYRWDAAAFTWVPLEGSPIITKFMQGDAWIDRAEAPVGLPDPPR